MTDASALSRRAFVAAAATASAASLLPFDPLSAKAVQTMGAARTGYPPLLDHLVWLAEDLDAACAQFERMSDVKPEYGGKHPGGTHNAIVGLGPQVYLEIVAPQAGADDRHPWVAAARRRPEPHLYSYCMRSAVSLADLASRAQQAGYRTIGPSAGSRNLPTGDLLEWELLIPLVSGTGGAMPFHIDWSDSPHPAVQSPSAARLTGFAAQHPDPDSIRAAMELFAPGVELDQSEGGVTLTAELDTPKGKVVLKG